LTNTKASSKTLDPTTKTPYQKKRETVKKKDVLQFNKSRDDDLEVDILESSSSSSNQDDQEF
jgi:hypothetical protein